MNRLARATLAVIPSGFLRFVSRNQWRSRTLRRICAWGGSLVKSQDAVILHGAGRGLRFNTAGSHSGFILGNHEPEVQAVLAAVLQPGMTYFDAGANVGFFAMIAARLVGPAGRVICFEPLPQNARQIEYNAGLNGFDNITVRCEALGDSDRTEAFNTSEEPTWGSLSSVGKEPVQASGHIVVQVRTLDSLASALPAPDLIKMDIEGAEVEALPGALATLAAARPVLVVELHRTNQAVLRVLEQLGYVAAVLGGSESVQDVAWDANIVAVPRERAAFLESIGKTPERLVSQ